MRIRKQLLEIIDSAKQLGLPEIDINNATENLQYNEYGLCLDIIVVQLFEYSIKIDAVFFELVNKVAVKMKIPEHEYLYLKELISSDQ